MREIKFRAWDVINEKMYPIAFPSWNGTTEGKRDFINHTVELIEEDGDDKPIIMQFTGLHDKNGKEIYEGDVVRREVCSPDDMAHGIYGYTGIVKWERGKFIIECDEDNSFYDHMGDLFSWNELEVIGNIYENPELLRG